MNMYFDWKSLISDLIQFFLTYLWCISIVDCTLFQKEKLSQKIRKWFIVICFISIIYFILYVGMVYFDAYIRSVQNIEWQNQSLLNIVLSIFYIIYNALILLLPTLMTYIGCHWVYNQTRSMKTFISVLVGLFAIVINEIICGFIMLPFLNNADSSSLKIKPDLLIISFIFICSYVIFYFLYKKYICSFIKESLYTPDVKMDHFVKVPLISVIVFTVLLSILQTFSITYLSKNWMDILIYMSSSGGLVLVYIMMYWAIFKGISLTAQTLKNQAELDVAKHIQTTVLPNIFPAFPDKLEFNIYASMETAKDVGGDFYDFFLIDDNHLSFVIADVSGKGIPAALFMMTARTLLKNLTMTSQSIEEIMNKANRSLCENNNTNMFVTAWLGILTLDSGKLEFINAGHNPPLIKSYFGDYKYLQNSSFHRNIMLGIMEDASYQKNCILLKPYDILYFYTDGVTEAMNEEMNLFGDERLKLCLDAVEYNNPQNIIRSIKENIMTFVGKAEQFDDITMMVLQYQANTISFQNNITVEQIQDINQQIEILLELNNYPKNLIYRVLIAIDEIYSNIVYYSQAQHVIIHYLINENQIIISFEDDGIYYNPLNSQIPPIHTSVKERKIGGLGIYLVKEIMDKVTYTYQNGKNIFIIQKERNEDYV